MWVTGTYDPESNQTFWGTGNPVPMFDPFHRPGDNLYTNSAISWNPETGNMNWYFQYTPGDMWDYDEVGTHILVDGNVDGQQRKLITHSARNGFLYTMERASGAMVAVKPYMDNVNWTKGIDPKTGKPVDYDPNKDIQTYAGIGNFTPGAPPKRVCPSQAGGNNYFPSSYNQRTKLIYIPALTACVDITIDREKHNKEKGWNGGLSTTTERWESNLTAVDPLTGEVKKSIHLKYPNYSGTLSTAGGLVFLALLDGTIAAFDENTLDELWKVNVGAGFSAPPMTFEVNSKQYIAIASGSSTASRSKLVNTPELRDQRSGDDALRVWAVIGDEVHAESVTRCYRRVEQGPMREAVCAENNTNFSSTTSSQFRKLASRISDRLQSPPISPASASAPNGGTQIAVRLSSRFAPGQFQKM
jgi:alcohol dehydrogenase (cytochrome c)